jgi:hypothetical protein
VLNTLDQELIAIASHTAAAKAHQEEHERAFAATMRDVLERQRDKGVNVFGRKVGGPAYVLGAGEKDSMDVDEPVESTKAKNRKYVDSRFRPHD